MREGGHSRYGGEGMRLKVVGFFLLLAVYYSLCAILASGIVP